jgi:hypothetical protein
MNISNATPFPIDKWSADMKAAIEQICEIGLQTMHTHRTANDKAAETADQWNLAERLEDERSALNQLFESVRQIIQALEGTRRLIHGNDVAEATLHQSMHESATTIDDNLPNFEQALLTVRHSALDLLRWTRRAGHLEESQLPGQYRASYANLLAYTPVFKPRLEAMQHELLEMSHGPAAHQDVQLLLSALTRYIGVVESARAFVRSVVEPPLELVFHDTDTFHDDWNKFEVADQSRLATEFNDCCQLLLYDMAEFHRRVDNVQPKLADGVDASLYVLSVDDVRVILTVDEDPVFEQLIVTLLRVVSVDDFENARDAVIQALYSEMSEE